MPLAKGAKDVREASKPLKSFESPRVGEWSVQQSHGQGNDWQGNKNKSHVFHSPANHSFAPFFALERSFSDSPFRASPVKLDASAQEIDSRHAIRNPSFFPFAPFA
jgi:hypothetical protein